MSLASRLAVDVSASGMRVPLSRARVVAAARAALRSQHVGAALVSITFVSAPRMAALNRTHLGRQGATDVIAFGFRRAVPTDPVIGDIYIAPHAAARSARALGIGVREELTRLVVHGTLHVLGLDHPADDTRDTSPMWKVQERLVRRLTRKAAA